MIYGTVKKGMFSNQRALFDELRKWEGKNIKVSVSKRVPKRSLPQNNYLWGIVYKTIGDFLGYTVDEVHEVMGQMFLKYHDKNGLERIRSTTELSTEEFTEYVEHVRRFFLQEYNIYTPNPNEQNS